MKHENIPVLIRQCLDKGIQISNYKLDNVLKSFEKSPMPDDKIKELNKEELDLYVDALYLITCEWQCGWSRGQKILKQLVSKGKKE